jgi:CTP synthase (UTP-ammonia lyase)
VAGIAEAAFEETAPGSPAPVITRLACSLRGLEQEVLIMPGTMASEAYGRERSTEKFRCSFGLNEQYRERIFVGGLRVSGEDAGGNVRIAEHTSHPFFMGTLFVPQESSTPKNPHPLIVAFVQAATRLRQSGGVVRSGCSAGEMIGP